MWSADSDRIVDTRDGGSVSLFGGVGRGYRFWERGIVVIK